MLLLLPVNITYPHQTRFAICCVSATIANTTTKEMWQTVKEYFRDGHALRSAPLCYNLHICDMKRPSATANSRSATQKDNSLWQAGRPRYVQVVRMYLSAVRMSVHDQVTRKYNTHWMVLLHLDTIQQVVEVLCRRRLSKTGSRQRRHRPMLPWHLAHPGSVAPEQKRGGGQGGRGVTWGRDRRQEGKVRHQFCCISTNNVTSFAWIWVCT